MFRTDANDHKPATNPLDHLPTPAEVHAHIGRLLRELSVARRLYRLSRVAAELPARNAAHLQAVANG